MTNRFGSFVFVVVSKREIVLVTDNELEAGMPFSHAVEPNRTRLTMNALSK